jgi:soluble lytic murein transglycosylase
MQVMPATGRQYAKKMGIKPFSPARLTEPEINARIGTRYFAELVRMFGGGTHYALASYNAGESRIARWRNEKPELEQDEFIDDIPFPETQNYVKRILGTAEDYRRLYGSGRQPSTVMRPAPAKYVAKPTAPKKKASTKKTAAKKSTAKKAAVKKPVTKKSSPRTSKK